MHDEIIERKQLDYSKEVPSTGVNSSSRFGYNEHVKSNKKQILKHDGFYDYAHEKKLVSKS